MIVVNSDQAVATVFVTTKRDGDKVVAAVFPPARRSADSSIQVQTDGDKRYENAFEKSMLNSSRK